MAGTELDSFLTKFKSLWASGQEANLTLKSKKGKVWINLEVGLQVQCPQHHHQGHGQAEGNARQRRKIRRAAARAQVVAEEVTVEATEADQVEERNKDAEKDTPQNVTGASAKEVANTKELLANDSTVKRNIDLESKIKILKVKIKDMEEQRECLNNTIAVNGMLHDDFKEKMKDKYLYESDDTESDYESDEEKREKNREEFREKKRLKKSRNNKCDVCDFIGKSEAGLKSHKTKKHKENFCP